MREKNRKARESRKMVGGNKEGSKLFREIYKQRTCQLNEQWLWRKFSERIYIYDTLYALDCQRFVKETFPR